MHNNSILLFEFSLSNATKRVLFSGQMKLNMSHRESTTVLKDVYNFFEIYPSHKSSIMSQVVDTCSSLVRREREKKYSQ